MGYFPHWHQRNSSSLSRPKGRSNRRELPLPGSVSVANRYWHCVIPQNFKDSRNVSELYFRLTQLLLISFDNASSLQELSLDNARKVGHSATSSASPAFHRIQLNSSGILGP
jgi:hypothetical protein